MGKGSGSGGARGGGSGSARGGGGSRSKGALVRLAQEGDTPSERAYALMNVMGGQGWFARGSTVYKAEDLGGDYMTEARISVAKKGYFTIQYTYSDGASYKEMFDSVASVSQAATKFFRRARAAGGR